MPLIPGNRRMLGRAMALTQVPVEMVGLLVLGLVGDNYLHTTPWLSVIGAVLGFVLGLSHLVIIVNQMNKDSSSESPRESP
jgi:F0F1-type ATP synthase assembly protein I